MKLTPAQFEALKEGYRKMREEMRARYGSGYTLPCQTPAQPGETVQSYEVAQ